MKLIYKLKTSKETMQTFNSIGASEGLQPYILSKIAVALSIRSGILTEEDFQSDSEGLELNRQTIFGEHESLFKALITMSVGKTLSEDEFFPKLVKAHLDRGSKLLANEVRYGINFYSNLLRLEQNL